MVTRRLYRRRSRNGRYRGLLTTIRQHQDRWRQQLKSCPASDENGRPGTPKEPEGQPVSEHLNIKVTDNNNEVFFKIKRTTSA